MKCIRMLAFSAFLACLGVIVGCGPRTTIVKGMLTVDGKPYGGATITFIAADGKGDGAGTLSNPDGSFEITNAADPAAGLKDGVYKVIVTKTSAIAGSAPDPSDPKASKEYMKAMMNAGKNSKSELPAKYAQMDKTPLSVTIPPESMPIKLDVLTK